MGPQLLQPSLNLIIQIGEGPKFLIYYPHLPHQHVLNISPYETNKPVTGKEFYDEGLVVWVSID